MEGQRPRRWPWILGAVVVVLGATATYLAIRFRDDVTEVSVDDARAEYEAAQATAVVDQAVPPMPTGPSASGPTTSPSAAVTTTTASGPVTSAAVATTTTTSTAPPITLFAPGVYAYRTTGFEEIDALGGARHDYPAETAVVVVAEGCGVRLTWTPFEERTESLQVCPSAGGLAIVGSTTRHEFFGVADQTDFVCPDGAWLLPPAPTTTATVTCTTPTLTEQRTLTVVGRSTVTVGGVSVDAVEIRIEASTSGPTTGSGVRHLVVAAACGLPLRWSDDTSNATETPIGVANYRESFQLELVSLDPLD